jgi:hypothetical protein
VLVPEALGFRILIISNSSYFKSLKNTRLSTILVLLGTVSFSLYLPVVFMHRVVLNEEHQNSTNLNSSSLSYKVERTSFGRSQTVNFYNNSLAVIRIICTCVVLPALNLKAICLHRSFINRKSNLQSLECKYVFASFITVTVETFIKIIKPFFFK